MRTTQKVSVIIAKDDESGLQLFEGDMEGAQFGVPIFIIGFLVIFALMRGGKKKKEAFLVEGAAAYIKKPFTPEVIREKLIQILGEMQDEEGLEDSDDGLDF